MKVRSYISEKLRAFDVSEAQLVDVYIYSGINLDAEVEDQEPMALGTALIRTIEELILAPRLTSINEGGFSMSWDFSKVTSYYLWLCRRWGIKPDDEISAMMGLSTIKDRTDMW